MDNAQAFAVSRNINLAPFTTWKIGGSARYFCEISADNISLALDWANAHKVPFCVMAGGSNVLVPDEGVDGLVIRLSRKDAWIRHNGGETEVSAAMPLGKLVTAMADIEVGGFDFLAGIPGTVGGAVFMNAGTGGEEKREISHVLKSVKAIAANGAVKIFTNEEAKFQHRRSVFHDNKMIIASAVFCASAHEEKASILEKIAKRLADRKLREPENKKNAGSVFKSADGKPAAIFIEQAELKGLRIGNAMVSLKHANWIENLGGASSADVLTLISEIKKRVFEKFSVELDAEVRVLKPY